MTKMAFGMLNSLRMRDSVALAQRAEELDYESVWFAEHNFSRDGVSICAATASLTTRIRIGPCVVPIFTRSALLMATTFAALDELSEGRIVMGVGAGSRLLIKAQGIEYAKPLTALQEYIEACRSVWAAHGHHVSYSGEIVHLEDAELDFEPLRRAIPIFIGATGPKACELSGRIADGVLLNVLLGTEYVKEATKLIRNGASQANRQLDGYDFGMMIMACLMDSKSEAYQHLRPVIAMYLSRLPDIAKHTSAWGERWDAMSAAVAVGGGVAGAAFVSDELIDEVSICGTARDCRDGLERYIDAGVTLPILVGFGDERRVLEELAPARTGIGLED